MNNRIEVRASRTPTEEILIKKCWKPDCNNVAVLRDGSGWEWCDKHVDQEKTGSVLHTEEERYDANYYRTKLRTALTTIAEEARLSGFADGYKQGRFDAEMDRLNSEEPASNNK